MAAKVVVVSPFVGASSQREGSLFEKLSDNSQNLLDNRFIQNQLIRQGTSLAGPALVAAGSTMITTGSAPRTEFRSHLQSKDTTGKKAFKPYEYRGRRYTKPLSRSDFGGNVAQYGYNTDYRSKHIKKNPAKVKTGKVVRGLGRASGVIGVGLVGYNIHRHGVQEAVHQEADTAWSFSPIGMADNLLFDNRIENYGLATNGYVKTIDNIAKFALLEALI